MKKLNHIVADLEYCKEIEKLGVKQKSLFYWSMAGQTPRVIHFEYEEKRVNDYYTDSTLDTVHKRTYYSAWTASELGEMLPYHYIVFGKLQFGEGYSCSISPSRNAKPEETVYKFGKTEADARAKMLIYLLKNNIISIISLEEVNKNI